MASLINCTGKETLLPRIASAYRETLFDAHGRQFVDLESGVWCLSLGHNHECTRDAMSNAEQELEHSGFNYGSGAAESAAERVCEFAGLPDGACLFLSSGSEAMEFALQVVTEVVQEGSLITLPKAYFGSYKRTNQRGESWQEVPWSMTEFEAGAPISLPSPQLFCLSRAARVARCDFRIRHMCGSSRMRCASAAG